jgi:hypothetical protein
MSTPYCRTQTDGIRYGVQNLRWLLRLSRSPVPGPAAHPRVRALHKSAARFYGACVGQCPKAAKYVLTAIFNDTKVLSPQAASDADRLIALKSLGHWVGDIHQPLHVSFEEDRGGNNINVNGQCSGNLHGTWDNCLVLYAVGPDASDAVTDLMEGTTPELQMRWAASDPRDWANESSQSQRPSRQAIAWCTEIPATCQAVASPSAPITLRRTRPS